MYQSKLIQVIKKFDAAKINNFSQYINAFKLKRFNTSVKLFEHIKNEYPDFTSKKIDKKNVHDILFPLKTYDEKRLLAAMSDLLKIVEEYIAFSYAKKNRLENQYYLLQFYLENNMMKYFESTYRQTEDILLESPEDADVLSFKYKLEMLYIQYQLKYNYRYSNYQNAYNTLKDFTVSQHYKLDNLCLINLYNNIDKDNINSRLAKIHQSLNEILLEFNDGKYYECKSAILQSIAYVSKDELRTLVIILVDYCIKKINRKEDVFINELLELYNFLIKEEIVFEPNNTISSALVKNYVTISIRLNKIQEATSFIEKFKLHIDVNERDDVYNFNKSNLLFHQGKSENALLLLNQTKYKDIFYKVSAKRLYIKIYYEFCSQNKKRYHDVLDSSLNAFKKYIYTSQELSDSVRIRNKSFYKYVNKLMNINKNEKKKIAVLLNDVKKDMDCSDREWILSVVYNLI